MKQVKKMKSNIELSTKKVFVKTKKKNLLKSMKERITFDFDSNRVQLHHVQKRD